jgi:hypothetical protein
MNSLLDIFPPHLRPEVEYSNSGLTPFCLLHNVTAVKTGVTE